METKRIVAVFDFDGTLTTKDTLLEFIKYACGIRRFYIGFLLHFPILVLMKIGLLPNWKTKEMIFSWFFKGMKYKEFERLGKDFAKVIFSFANQDTTKMLSNHLQDRNEVYVITASIEEWVRPYCNLLNVKAVLGTKVEVEGGLLTGRFASKNCYGKEKVSRLLEAFPDRNSYFLYAYGDSAGDKDLLEFADKGVLIS